MQLVYNFVFHTLKSILSSVLISLLAKAILSFLGPGEAVYISLIYVYGYL